MSKRKSTASSSATNLRLYQKSYKGGAKKDSHFRVFQETRDFIALNDLAQKVLYPGCHRHLTASLIFPHVTYVDCDKKVGPLYQEIAAKEYVEENKIYTEETTYEFHCANVDTANSVAKLSNDYDLLISLSAGLLAQPCTKYIRPGGWLLVNDSHCDARSIHVNGNDQWELKAYWDDHESVFATDSLERCFQAIDKKTKQDPLQSFASILYSPPQQRTCLQN